MCVCTMVAQLIRSQTAHFKSQVLIPSIANEVEYLGDLLSPHHPWTGMSHVGFDSQHSQCG